MSTYNGRRGPNVSQYLQDLNAVNPQEPAADDSYNIAMFTNTEFFDFDSGQNTDFQAAPVKPNVKAESTFGDGSAAQSVVGDIGEQLDFLNNDFGYHDFGSGFPSAGPAMKSFDGPSNFPSVPAAHDSQMYGALQMPQQHQYSQGSTPASQGPGDKQKPENASSSTLNFEDVSRHAAEEDKRRRNTAASARFRVKKKQREQALEKSAKEMTDKVTALESRVSQLETENKWLKNLLVEKNEGNENIATMWKEFTKQAGEKLKASSSKR